MQIPRLREWRERRALTQVELAERAGVSARSVAGYEAGGGARLSTVRKLAQTLGIDVTDLYGEAGHPLGEAPPSQQLTLNGELEEERRQDDEAALAILFRGLARRARLTVERSRREGPSVELGKDAAALHAEAAALYRLRGSRDIRGTGSEDLATAVDTYEEVEDTIQVMLRQDVEASDEERATARRFRPDAKSKQRKADAS